MPSTNTAEDPRSETEVKMAAIERERFGQCLWQTYPGDRTLVEAFHYPKANSYAVVVKHFDGKVRNAKKWPKMVGCEVYLPADASSTWDGLAKALDEFEASRIEKPAA